MKIATTLDEILKNRGKATTDGASADTYDAYKHKSGSSYTRDYSDAVNALYASSKRDLSSYGTNSRNLSNKGLQNSGYAAYIDNMAEIKLDKGLDNLKDKYAKLETDTLASYRSYLDKYRDKTNSLKNSVMSHLIKNDVVDLSTAIAYGMSAGLSREDAQAVGKSVYEVTKERLFNTILEQTVSLGLDKEGARMLAIKMGVSEADAKSFSDEIGELLDYYGNISKEYLDFLEQRAN